MYKKTNHFNDGVFEGYTISEGNGKSYTFDKDDVFVERHVHDPNTNSTHTFDKDDVFIRTTKHE